MDKPVVIPPALLMELDSMAKAGEIRQPWSEMERTIVCRYRHKVQPIVIKQMLEKAGYKRTLAAVSCMISKMEASEAENAAK